ncbi:MAG: rod shape-determining protein MreC [Chroococcidiopsidaceae cyanobacterium CP_BM_RX_35]|nr:rod shape-determining protein MreC [Chroococcidiopsidaceae cyanobacterium CP_BM_RX_35]
MYALRRWWERYRLQLVLVSLVFGFAWAIRQTQGAVVFEVYQWMTRPFQSAPTRTEQLSHPRILELEERLAELDSQNHKLKELLGYVEHSELQRPLVAPVIGRGADNWWQQVILGRGSEDGIEIGFIAMATGGLVGRIESVTPHTCRVLLISDPSSQVGVTISRSRDMGLIQGQSTTHVVMQFFDKVPNVRRGDFVSTSTYSQLFPPGLPVGRVESVSLNASPAPKAIVTLSTPIRDLEWVVVYSKGKNK